MATYYWVGGTGTWDASSFANWSLSSGGVPGVLAPNSADTVIFDSASGTGTCTTAAGSVCATATLNSATLGLTLGANHTMSGTFTLTLGTLTISNYVLTCNIFSSSNSNIRNITFGSGSIDITGNNTTIWTSATSTNFTISGTSKVNCIYAGSTGTRTIGALAASGEAHAINFNISAGSDIINIVANSALGYLNFTGYTGISAVNNATRVFYGDLTLAPNMTFTSGASVTFFSSTSNQKITSNNVTLDFPITQNGIGGTVQLQDNLTARSYTLTQGTLDLSSGNRTLSIGVFASTNSNTRAIAFGGGNITLTGSGTVWNTGTPTNFSRTGTPTVNISNNSATATTVSTGAMTEAQSLNFNYTTGTYTLTDTAARYKSVNFTGFAGTIPNSVRTIFGSFTLSAGMTLTAGANATTFAGTSGTAQITTAGKTLDFPLSIDGVGGTFAFQDALTQGSTRAFTVTNGTVQLKNGVTSTVGSFVTSGTTQKFLQSTLAGTQATLSQASGTVSAAYLTVKDSNATGGATWNAFITSNNIDAGNNNGWDFSEQVGRYIYTRRKNKRILP